MVRLLLAATTLCLLSTGCAGSRVVLDIPGRAPVVRRPLPPERGPAPRAFPDDVVEVKEIHARTVSARVIYAKEVHARDGRVGRIEESKRFEKGDHGGSELKTRDVVADTIYAKEIHADFIDADVIYAKEVHIGR